MTPSATYGAMAYDVAHLLGGVALVLSFALLARHRLSALITIYAAQAGVLAAAAAWQAFVQHAPALYATAAVTFAVKCVAMPMALRQMLSRLDLRAAADPGLGVFPTLASGVALVTLATLAVLPMTLSAPAVTREDLALALSVVLLGMLMMVTRRSALALVIGFLSLENGLILAAVGVAAMPMLIELSVAVLVLVAFLVLGAFVRRMRTQFQSVDTAHLDQVMRARL
jgi:hydrogenase-4 component E